MKEEEKKSPRKGTGTRHKAKSQSLAHWYTQYTYTQESYKNISLEALNLHKGLLSGWGEKKLKINKKFKIAKLKEKKNC